MYTGAELTFKNAKLFYITYFRRGPARLGEEKVMVVLT